MLMHEVLTVPVKKEVNMGGNQDENKNNGYEIIFTPLDETTGSNFLSNIKEIPSLKIGDYNLHLDLDDLSPEVAEIARRELRETPDVTRDAIESLRQLLKNESDLKVPVDNDKWLIRFLRPCKFYPESAFELIKRYYKFKVTHSDVYKGLKPSKEKNVFQQNILIFQQERDQHGRRILTIQLGKKWKPNEVTLDEFFKGAVLLLELALLEPQIQVCGVVIIIDMDGLSFSQATKFTPMFLKRLLDWLQDCIPIRIKNIHVVNQPPVFTYVYKIMKLFLRNKLRQRLILHGTNRQSLQKYINTECLPMAFGGTLNIPTTIDGRMWLNILIHCDEEYEALNTYGYLDDKI